MDYASINFSRITLVCGPICSGKSTMCNKIAAYDPSAVTVISVSKIVAAVYGQQEPTRKQLQDTADLVDDICIRLDQEISEAQLQYKHVLVDGVRQPEIVEYLISLYGIANVTVMWIDPGRQERELRWKMRAAKKDVATSFEEIEDRDNQMGLLTIRDWVALIAGNYAATTLLFKPVTIDITSAHKS